MYGSLGMLGIILIILKLAGVEPFLDISWFLILLPFYFGFAVVALVTIIAFFLTAVVGFCVLIASLF